METTDKVTVLKVSIRVYGWYSKVCVTAKDFMFLESVKTVGGTNKMFTTNVKPKLR